jgi:hypothetical protein
LRLALANFEQRDEHHLEIEFAGRAAFELAMNEGHEFIFGHAIQFMRSGHEPGWRFDQHAVRVKNDGLNH